MGSERESLLLFGNQLATCRVSFTVSRVLRDKCSYFPHLPQNLLPYHFPLQSLSTRLQGNGSKVRKETRTAPPLVELPSSAARTPTEQKPEQNPKRSIPQAAFQFVVIMVQRGGRGWVLAVAQDTAWLLLLSLPGMLPRVCAAGSLSLRVPS